MAKAKKILDLDCQAPVGQNARHIARIRLEEMHDWAKYADAPYHSKELHNLRIAAKRLRYTLELFEDALPETSKAIVDELTQVQDELGLLHDSDVLIALLRLCLGSQEGGAAYEQALTHVRKQKRQKGLMLPPALVAAVLDHNGAPSAEERFGLEQLLLREHHIREERYAAFREHWFRLQERDFRREVLHLLDQPSSEPSEATTGSQRESDHR